MNKAALGAVSYTYLLLKQVMSNGIGVEVWHNGCTSGMLILLRGK